MQSLTGAQIIARSRKGFHTRAPISKFQRSSEIADERCGMVRFPASVRQRTAEGAHLDTCLVFKQVPTAAFDTVFDDGRQSVTDDRAYLNATYEGAVRRGWSTKGSGIEAEVEVKLARGFASRFSHSYARTHDTVSGGPIANSPRHLSKLGLQVPVASFFVGIEGQYVGERLTLDGERCRERSCPT